MKYIIQFITFLSIILFIKVNSFAVPMTGAYTIGAGGNFPLISDAIAAMDSLGIGAPVTFRIFSGSYHETNYLKEVANSNSSNTVTFESFANNADSVVITGPLDFVFRIEGAKNLIIRKLTLQEITLSENCQNIHISNNKFTDHSIKMILDVILGFYITGNSGLGGIMISSPGNLMQAVTISDNDFTPLSSYLILKNIRNLTLSGNTNLGNVDMSFINTAEFAGNKMKSNRSSLNSLEIKDCDIIFMKNNFIDSREEALGVLFKSNNYLDCMNNTFRNEGLDTTLSCRENTGLELRNNIYNNAFPGVSVSLWNNSAFVSDYNTYYNGTENNIIQFNGALYTLAGFQGATGQGMHSNRFEVPFASPGDLHLNSSNGGNPLLAGDPHPDVVNDIDGEPRNPFHPYRGADELDHALPVELLSFTSGVTGNDITLSWTTIYEQNNSGFEIQRTGSNNQWKVLAFVKSQSNTGTNNYFYEDKNLSSGNYKYRLKQIDFSGNFQYYNLSNEINIGEPNKFELSQNYPNPFNPVTKIEYEIPSAGNVSLKIYDLTGREVLEIVNEVKSAGYYTNEFNADNLSSGVYFYRLTLQVGKNNFVNTKQMIVLK